MPRPIAFLALLTLTAHLTSATPFHPTKDQLITCKTSTKSPADVYQYLTKKHVDIWSHGVLPRVNFRWPPVSFSSASLVTNKGDAELDEVVKYFDNQCAIVFPDLDLYAINPGDTEPVFVPLKKEAEGFAAAAEVEHFEKTGIDSDSNDEENIAFNSLLRKTTRTARDNTNPFFQDYQSYDAIASHLEELAKQFPGYVKFEKSVGKSVEQRDIVAVRVSNYNNAKKNGEGKRGVVFLGGMHAREWISPATLLYLLTALVTSNSPLLDKIEIHAIPVVNPDGYEYTRTSSRARWWRKNRAIINGKPLGVDLNRNFDEHFGKIGASNDPTSDTYNGPKAFSEPETQAVRDFVMGVENRYVGIDFHCSGQLILRSWGWTYDNSKNEVPLKQLGDQLATDFNSISHRRWTSERGVDLYPASGASDDWMTMGAGLVAYTVELPGTWGFSWPANKIVDVGEEVLFGVTRFLEDALERKLPKNEYMGKN